MAKTEFDEGYSEYSRYLTRMDLFRKAVTYSGDPGNALSRLISTVISPDELAKSSEIERVSSSQFLTNLMKRYVTDM